MNRMIATLLAVATWSVLLNSPLCGQAPLRILVPQGDLPTNPGSDLPSRIGQTLLYDQLCSWSDPTENGLVSTSRDRHYTEGAADFQVPSGKEWIIETITAFGTCNTNRPVESFKIRFYRDDNGKPGRLVYGSTEPAFQPACIFDAIYDVSLSSPCILTSGSYWLSIQGVFTVPNSAWYWTIVDRDGLSGQWRNLFHPYLSEWCDIAECPDEGNARDFCFSLSGNTRTPTEEVYVVAEVGGVVPGVPLTAITDLRFPTLSGNGQIAFTGKANTGSEEEAFVWIDDRVVLCASDFDLSSPSDNIAVGNEGQFLLNSETGGLATLRNHLGILLTEGDPAPGYAGRFLLPPTFPPRMRPDGVGYMILSHASLPGGSSAGETLYEVSPSGEEFTVLLDQGGPVPGGAITNLDPRFDVSDDGSHRIHLLSIDTGRQILSAVWIDGRIALREGDLAGSGSPLLSFQDCAVNNSGVFVVAATAESSSHYLLVNGTIAVQDGDEIAGEILPPDSEVVGMDLNNRGQVAHLWETSTADEILFVGDAAMLSQTSKPVLRRGDPVDTDGDGSTDATVEQISIARGVTRSFSFSDTPYIFVRVSLRDLLGNSVQDAIVQISVPSAGSSGTVNAAAGEIRDVLFVNGSSGGRDRTVEVDASDPISFALSQAVSPAQQNRNVLWVWRGLGRNPSMLVKGGTPLGTLVNPIPVQPGGPQPKICLPGPGVDPEIACGNVVVGQVTQAAPFYRRFNLNGREVVLTLQGVLEEGASGHPGGFSVTNSVTVISR